jgi:hypothetical protein
MLVVLATWKQQAPGKNSQKTLSLREQDNALIHSGGDHQFGQMNMQALCLRFSTA